MVAPRKCASFAASAWDSTKTSSRPFATGNLFRPRTPPGVRSPPGSRSKRFFDCSRIALKQEAQPDADGPKRRFGDEQVPEGFYELERHHRPPIVRVDGGGRYAFSVK